MLNPGWCFCCNASSLLRPGALWVSTECLSRLWRAEVSHLQFGRLVDKLVGRYCLAKRRPHPGSWASPWLPSPPNFCLFSAIVASSLAPSPTFLLQCSRQKAALFHHGLLPSSLTLQWANRKAAPISRRWTRGPCALCCLNHQQQLWFGKPWWVLAAPSWTHSAQAGYGSPPAKSPQPSPMWKKQEVVQVTQKNCFI